MPYTTQNASGFEHYWSDTPAMLQHTLLLHRVYLHSISMLLTRMLSNNGGGWAAIWPSVGQNLMVEEHRAVILIRSWQGRITWHTLTARAARSCKQIQVRDVSNPTQLSPPKVGGA